MSGSVTSATTTSATGTTAAAQTSLTGDFNTFLKMLTTQLQNQDPTNAMDPTEMTNQLVAFSGVEQQINMNSNLQAMISLQQAQALATGDNLVGRTIEVSGGTLPLVGGSATVQLPAAGAAQVARLSISDAAGNVVAQPTVQLGAAAGPWTWNGQNSAGQTMPDGAYTISATGMTNAGTATGKLAVTSLATATGIQRQNNTLELMFGSTGVSMDNVASVQ